MVRTPITLSPVSCVGAVCPIYATNALRHINFSECPLVLPIFSLLAYLLNSSALWKPYRVEKDKLRAVNKKLKKYALWSEKRDGNVAGDTERRRAKKIKREA